MSLAQLIKEIEGAFASVHYPGDDSIVRDIDEDRGNNLLQAFRGLHWSDVTIELVNTWRKDLGYFTDEGFRFFLPGFIIVTLTRLFGTSNMLEDHLMYALMPPDEDSDNESEFQNRMSAFNAKQEAAIAKFVDYVFWNSPNFDNRERGKMRAYWQSNAVLMEEIRRVFEGVSYPGDDNLIKNPEYPESFEMLQAFRGLHWHDINVDTAEYWYQNTGRLTDEGFRFFLPAFLYAALHENSTNLSSYLIYEFIPPNDATKLDAFRKRFDELNTQQKTVIGEFIEYILDSNLILDRESGEKTRSFWRIN